MQISSPIIPAIIPQSYDDLVLQVKKITSLPEVHVDVVDGVFVPSVSWPYSPEGDVVSARDLLARFSLEVDLMVSKPLPAAVAWLAAGADQLVFHVETISVEAFAQFVADCPVSVGIACNNSTPLAVLYDYVPHADYVQCMGIATIGSQGQPFDEGVIERMLQIRQQFPQMAIAIDGSINESTIPKLIPLGLARFIVGSAIIKAEHPRDVYAKLTQLAQS
jgi:ribulose-phosphate 3-epimerase